MAADGLASHARHVIGENPLTAAAFALFAMFIVLAVAGPWLAPYDPLATDAAVAMQPPSMRHWFGTDSLGRDVLSRVMAAARVDFGIALSAVLLSSVLGIGLGMLAGYYGGWFDRGVGRVGDTIMAFPLFVLATAIINLPFYLRVARAETNIRRDAGFIEAARVTGNGTARVLTFHMLPNILPPAMVQISLNMGLAILNCAGLSFIGLGVRPPQPEWGIMVAEGAQYIVSGEWWVALFPGAVLMLAVFCFNLLGDGLRDIIDPRRRT